MTLIVDTEPKYISWDDVAELAKEQVSNADSDGGLVPVYFHDRNPHDPDEGLDVVLMVHPHWTPEMLLDHLRHAKIEELFEELSPTMCFGDIMFSANSGTGPTWTA